MEQNAKSPLEKGHEALAKLIEVCQDAGNFNRDLLLKIQVPSTDKSMGLTRSGQLKIIKKMCLSLNSPII